MRLSVALISLTAMLTFALPAAADRSLGGTVVVGSAVIGGRFDRTEWLERSTGATRREDIGGPSCKRVTVATREWIRWSTCGFRDRKRVRGAGDPDLIWRTSDLLLPRRLLRSGRSRVVEEVRIGDRRALRIDLPPNDWIAGLDYIDVDPHSLLPLRLVTRNRDWSIEVEYRTVARHSLHRRFFTP
jgi:hypothetical protein